jgi:hypothetical protein
MSAHLSRLRLFQRHLRSLVWVWVWVWDWIHSHTPPRTRSPSSRHPPLTHYPFPLRSLVCGGQPSPHKPRLVVSHSTCPPLSSSPHAHSFVLGTAVINTHTCVVQFTKSPHGLFNIRGLQQGESDSGHLGTAKNWDCPSRTCTRSDSTNARANALLLTNSATTSTAARNTGAPRRVLTGTYSQRRAAAIHQGYSPRDDDDVFCLFLQKQN